MCREGPWRRSWRKRPRRQRLDRRFHDLDGFMTWIKICGITTLEDALAAARAGANAVGFVFYEPSPRNIKPEIACSIAEQLPEETEKIGVFVNEPADRVSRIADLAGLTAVQLHGDEYRDTARLVLNR